MINSVGGDGGEKMKKIIFLFITVLFLAGCANTHVEDTGERLSRGHNNFYEASDHFEQDYSE